MLDREFWKDKRVLLTGHTGFKGSWIALWLIELGANVFGLALPPQDNSALFNQLDVTDKLRGHYLQDINDFENISRIIQEIQPEVVIHLAAQPLVRRSFHEPLETWRTNVIGSVNLLESLKSVKNNCAVVMVTTDKVYCNREWNYGYRENDELGGYDPYSASKAAAELAIKSWRSSFVGRGIMRTPHLAIATARAGNVIGGGDWAEDRIIPDFVRSISAGKKILLRNPKATRPWQHVLEPVGGYLLLCEKLMKDILQSDTPNDRKIDELCSAFNFGPNVESNRSVSELVETCINYWEGSWGVITNAENPHEAGLLHLNIEKAYNLLGWQPRWPFATTIERTMNWYQKVHAGEDALKCCKADLEAYRISAM